MFVRIYDTFLRVVGYLTIVVVCIGSIGYYYLASMSQEEGMAKLAEWGVVQMPQLRAPQQTVKPLVFFPASSFLDISIREKLQERYLQQLVSNREVLSSDVPPFLFELVYNPQADSISLSLLKAIDCQCVLNKGTMNLIVEQLSLNVPEIVLSTTYLEGVHIEGYPGTPAQKGETSKLEGESEAQTTAIAER